MTYKYMYINIHFSGRKITVYKLHVTFIDIFLHNFVDISQLSYSAFILHLLNFKGNHTFADLRYGEEDIISPSTLIFAATKG